MTGASSASTRNTKQLNQSQTDRTVQLFSVDPYMLLLQKDQETPCGYKKNARRMVLRSVLSSQREKPRTLQIKSYMQTENLNLILIYLHSSRNIMDLKVSL